MSSDTPVPQEEHKPEVVSPVEDGKAEPAFLIAGVGGSAGGLEAFTELLRVLPEQSNLALLYVQHLEPHSESMLAQILSRAASIPVTQAQDGMQVQKGHIYVIPPNRVMTYKAGKLALRPRQDIPGLFMPFDHLCRALADQLGNQAVGVVLSGTGTDGTTGLAAIRAQGGITFAQDQSARYQEMPRSAIADGQADFVLPPAEIAHHLQRLANHAAVVLPDPQVNIPEDSAGLQTIFRLLRTHTSVDFSHYKASTIKRRIRRRMGLHNLENFAEYVELLDRDPAAVQALYHDLLIRVTNFFRDPVAFDALKDTVFPQLFQGRSPQDPVRIWVAGCSTGEEVYSTAIALLEYLGDMALTTSIKILATDISEAAVDKARQGSYIENIEMDVSPERLRRFFTKTNSHYEIIKSIRDLCVFARHNLFSDPPFSRLDLITCRNVLIYLDLTLQRKILPLFHYALKPGGMLMLGLSESIGGFTDLFTPVDEKHRIYAKKLVPSGVSFELEMPLLRTAAGMELPITAARKEWLSAADVQREADRTVLNRYSPAGVVIDEYMTIVQFRGHTGPYLEPAPGIASLNLLNMLREGLLVEVRTAITLAKSEHTPVRREKLLVREGENFRPVNVEVLPIRIPLSGVRYFVVLFEDVPEPEKPELLPEQELLADQEMQAILLKRQNEQLQQELAATREYLQSLTEEYEATSEELKSANEEILSSNEELQSTNEELQTAKEEMQSANEELGTLNEELKNRNFELGKVNNDLLNLLAGVNIPIIMVGRDLRIRRFTPQAEKLLNLIPTDVGRPLSDIRPNVHLEQFDKLICEVIETLLPREIEVKDKDGIWYVLRIRPYITQENKIDGATIAAVDISKLKESVEQLKESRD